MKIEENDVFRFRYNQEYLNKLSNPDQFFDGQLIVHKDREGNLYLRDTYWGTNNEDKEFTLEEALECGELVFVCNLNDVVECKESDIMCYRDTDIYDLSTQHNAHNKYYRKKNAKVSYIKVEKVIENKVEELRNSVEYKAKNPYLAYRGKTSSYGGYTRVFKW